MLDPYTLLQFSILLTTVGVVCLIGGIFSHWRTERWFWTRVVHLSIAVGNYTFRTWEGIREAAITGDVTPGRFGKAWMSLLLAVDKRTAALAIHAGKRLVLIEGDGTFVEDNA